MRVCISGTVNIVELRYSNDHLELGWDRSSSLSITDLPNGGLGLTFHSEPVLDPSIQWINLKSSNPKLSYGTLEIEITTNNTYYMLKPLEDLCLVVSGTQNTIFPQVNSSCRTKLQVSGHLNRINFERSPSLLEMNVQIEGVENIVENLCWMGASHSYLNVKNHSCVYMYLCPAFEERYLQCERDATSIISALLPDTEERNVQSPFELWCIDTSLKSIDVQRQVRLPEHSAAAETVQRSVCTICLNSTPDHLLRPCKHLCYCEACYNKAKEQPLCPVCRVGVEAVEKIYTIVGY